MNIQIKKVKMDSKGRLKIIYVQHQDDGSKDPEIEHNDPNKVHPDFEKSISNMAVHYGLLTEHIKGKDVKDPAQFSGAELDKLFVRGITVGGEDEQEWVILSGHRIQTRGRALIMNTPVEYFNAEDTKRYPFMDALIKVWEDVKDEAIKYLGGKYAEEPQGELKFDKGGIAKDQNETTR